MDISTLSLTLQSLSSTLHLSGLLQVPRPQEKPRPHAKCQPYSRDQAMPSTSSTITAESGSATSNSRTTSFKLNIYRV